jgi:hypothetical protein
MMTCTLMISTAIEIPPSVVPCSAAVSHSKIMPFMTHRPSTPEPKTTSRPGWLEGNRRERFPSTMRGGIVVYAIFLGLMLFQRSAAQIPRACADRQSLEQMTCCPVTDDGVCGEDAERGECDAVNFERHRNDTTDVRVNWPHYYTLQVQRELRRLRLQPMRVRILRKRLRFQSNHSPETQSGISARRNGRISLPFWGGPRPGIRAMWSCWRSRCREPPT